MSEERAERRTRAAAGGGTIKKCFKNSLVFCFYGHDARGFFDKTDSRFKRQNGGCFS